MKLERRYEWWRFTPEVKETLSSLLLCWEQPIVGSVVTVRQFCDEAKDISPKNVSLCYSSRSTALQHFFYLRWNKFRHCGFNSGLHFLEEARSKYEDAVHYLAVRWLDKSAVLNKHLHFWIVTDIFMMEIAKLSIPQLSDEKWAMALTFIVGKKISVVNLVWKFKEQVHYCVTMFVMLQGLWHGNSGLLLWLHFIARRKYRNYF